MNVLLVIVGLVASAAAKDLIVGQEGGSIIFKQNVTASPAIWRQTRNLTVNATEHEVITRVVIVDNREDKNGEATIVEGGEGFKNVTIELKSPTVFRGFDFEVQVYAEPEKVAQKPLGNDQTIIPVDLDQDTDVNKQVPKEEDSDVNIDSVPLVPSSTEQVSTNQDEVKAPQDSVPAIITPVSLGPQGEENIQATKDEKDVVPKEPVIPIGVQDPQHEEEHPVVAGKDEPQHPVVAGKDEEQLPVVTDKAEEQRPVVADKEGEQRPVVADKDKEQRPVVAEKDDKQESQGSQQEEQKPVDPTPVGKEDETNLNAQVAQDVLDSEELSQIRQIPKRFQKL